MHVSIYMQKQQNNFQLPTSVSHTQMCSRTTCKECILFEMYSKQLSVCYIFTCFHNRRILSFKTSIYLHKILHMKQCCILILCLLKMWISLSLSYSLIFLKYIHSYLYRILIFSLLNIQRKKGVPFFLRTYDTLSNAQSKK